MLDKALPPLNSLRYYEFPPHCLKLGAGGEFPKRPSNERNIITYVCPQTPAPRPTALATTD